jgi:hypothetical protein
VSVSPEEGSASQDYPAAGGKHYFSSETGIIFVIQAGPDYELLAKNEMVMYAWQLPPYPAIR